MTPRERAAPRLVRTYVVTEGRAYPSRNTLEADTLVLAADEEAPGDRVASGDQEEPGDAGQAAGRSPVTALGPEKRRLLALCGPGALSVAEAAGRLGLPVSVTKVLVADLVDSGALVVRPPVPPAEAADPRILQEVLDGLRARL
ncbi:DUF742 domain-containing protein [Streptomyces sp. NPDC059786]|uniref:DUF742 domain-containing protein n=1 Tax=Streptomyces sp. NPDC059786 TaxID=3346946 RepID=UPI003657190D